MNNLVMSNKLEFQFVYIGLELASSAMAPSNIDIPYLVIVLARELLLLTNQDALGVGAWFFSSQ